MSDECPRCSATRDPLSPDAPALTQIGYNPGSGVLYRCLNCHHRVTEASVRTGEPNALAALEVLPADEQLTTWHEWDEQSTAGCDDD